MFTAQADHELENPGMYGLAPLGLPAQCGPSEVVNQYIQKFDFIPETFSVAREEQNQKILLLTLYIRLFQKIEVNT